MNLPLVLAMTLSNVLLEKKRYYRMIYCHTNHLNMLHSHLINIASVRTELSSFYHRLRRHGDNFSQLFLSLSNILQRFVNSYSETETIYIL